MSDLESQHLLEQQDLIPNNNSPPHPSSEPISIHLGNNSFIEKYPYRVKEEYKKIICCQLITFITRERRLANFIYLIASVWMFVCVLIGGSLFSAALSTVDEADCGAAATIYGECGKLLNCSTFGGNSMNVRGMVFEPNIFMIVSNLNRSVDNEKMKHVIDLACPELCYKNNQWDFNDCQRNDIKYSNICLNYDSEYCLVSELMLEGVHSLIELKRFDIGVVYVYFIQPFLPLILINVLQNIADVALDLIRNTKSIGRMLIISVLTLVSHLLFLIPIIAKYETTFGKWNVFNLVQPLISSFFILSILDFVMPFFRALYSDVPKVTLGEKLLTWVQKRRNRKSMDNEISTLPNGEPFTPLSIRIKKHFHTIKNTLFNSKIIMDYTEIPNENQSNEYVNLTISNSDNSSINPTMITRLNAIFLLFSYLILLFIFECLCGIAIILKIISTSRGYFICITVAYLITSFAFITMLCMKRRDKTWIGKIIQILIVIVSFSILVGSFTYYWISFTFQPFSY